MFNNILHSLDLWLETKISSPHCTNKQIYVQKSAWKNNAFSFIHTLAITVGVLILVPRATLYIHYGFIMMIVFIVTLSLFLLVPRYFISVGFLMSLILQLVTFYYILRLGGIPTSGGLIFVGIVNVLASVTRQRIWYSVLLFTLYIIQVILAVALKPWLHVPDYITPGLNSFCYMINIVLLSGPVLFFVLYFIRQQRKFEELETGHLKEIRWKVEPPQQVSVLVWLLQKRWWNS